MTHPSRNKSTKGNGSGAVSREDDDT